MKNIFLFLIILFSSNIIASNLTYTITNEKKTESIVNIKNNKQPVYLNFTCNNFLNEINVNLKGINPDDFYESNVFKARTIFGKSFNNYKWNGVYDEKGNFYLKLDGNGLIFTKNLYKSGKILLDMKELKKIHLFEFNNKFEFQKNLDFALKNCGIYL